MARKKENRDARRSRGQNSQQPGGQQGYQPYQQPNGQRIYDPYQQPDVQAYQQTNSQAGYDGYPQGQAYQQMNSQPGYDGYPQGQAYQQMNSQPGYDGYPQGQAYQQMNSQPGYDGYPQGQPYQQMNGQPGYNAYQQVPYYQQPFVNREAQEAALKKKKRRRTRKIIMFIAEVLILLILAGSLYVAATLSKMETVELENEEEIKQQVAEQLDDKVVEKLSGYWNIALYGVDSRVGETDSQTRTDAIMVASINRKTKDVKLVSVYRDTYLDNTDGQYRKATECYEAGGPSRSINMLNRNLDLDITNFVTVDMSILAEVVDRIGGIEMEIREGELVHLNNYQVEGSDITGKEKMNIEEPGVHLLNGLQTVSYCRIRQTDGADYERTERQRKVLGKILDKVQNLDLLTLTGMIDDLLPYITTNLTKTELFSLAKDVASYKIGETVGFPFTQVSLPDMGYIIAPATLETNVIQLHDFLFGGEEAYTPSQTVQEISDYIADYTGVYEE